VTNFPYFMTESNFSGELPRRHVLVIDEAHNIESQLSRFIEISVSEYFAKHILKLKMPDLKTQKQVHDWIRGIYFPKLSSHCAHIERMFKRYTGIAEKVKECVSLSKQLDLLQSHLSKMKTFLKIYDKNNWIMNEEPSSGRKGRKFIFKPIDVAPYAEDYLFRMGYRVIMMSATILNSQGFCESLGINHDDAAFISISSPFPVENRPLLYTPVGKMSRKSYDDTLPKLIKAIEEIIKNHPNEKGIIHTHTFKTANAIKRAIRSRRFLMHDSDNREEILERHITSKKPTILLTPSMTEGVDLSGDASRFQIICKIPYPYLGDKLCRKRMNKWKWWYPMQTAKTIVQSVGRSVRDMEDHAITYILDEDWGRFYGMNKNIFPKSFTDAIVKN
jgi:Rad3-related DNA helicase